MTRQKLFEILDQLQQSTAKLNELTLQLIKETNE